MVLLIRDVDHFQATQAHGYRTGGGQGWPLAAHPGHSVAFIQRSQDEDDAPADERGL